MSKHTYLMRPLPSNFLLTHKKWTQKNCRMKVKATDGMLSCDPRVLIWDPEELDYEI